MRNISHDYFAARARYASVAASTAFRSEALSEASSDGVNIFGA